VTIVFALIDAKVGPAALIDVNCSPKTLLDSWDPRTLPPVPRHPSTVPLWQLVLDLVGAALLLAWWLAVPSHPFLLFGPGAAFLAPGPGLLASYVPVAMLVAMAVVARAIALWQPSLRPVLGLVCRVLSVVGVVVVWWNGGPYIVPAMATPPADLAKGMIWIERTVTVSLVVVTVINVVDLVREAWRFWLARRPRAGAASASTPPGSLR
jgi:hypothetical protein